MINIKSKILQKFTDYIRCGSAAVAVAFGMMVPVVVTAVGVSVDMSQAYMVRERLSRAVDSSALAAAATADGEDAVLAKVSAFFQANFPDAKIGDAFDLDVTVSGGEVHVSARARVDTAFLEVIGQEYIVVFAEATVVRQVQGLEVVMVLDNTGSMSSNDNIEVLKTASASFVDILFERVSNPEHVKIGLVPYSSSVNVGPYGLGLDESGAPYDTAFVIPPADDLYADYNNPVLQNSSSFGIDEADLVYDQSSFGQWHGCVLAHDFPLDTEDHDGPWEMYRFDHHGSSSSFYDDIYSSGFTYGDLYNSARGPNQHCPRQSVVPLTNNQELLLGSIDNMNANGFTLGNYGMVWGWRVISPEFPFEEGAEYNDDQWQKVVLMMTDGMNTMNDMYTAYGRTDQHSIGTSTENARFAEVCESMKQEGILIYTVTFYSNVDEGTKEFYRQCATDETKFYDAPTQDDLVEVFESISRDLSNLHIKL